MWQGLTLILVFISVKIVLLKWSVIKMGSKTWASGFLKMKIVFLLGKYLFVLHENYRNTLIQHDVFAESFIIKQYVFQ